MARKTVVWHGKRRYIKRLARLYREGLSTHAIARVESSITGGKVRACDVFNALRLDKRLSLRPLPKAMRNAPSLVKHANVRL